MNIELVTNPARLAALADPWNALAAGSPLLSWEWMSLWWKHYGQPLADRDRAALYVVAVWDGNQLAGLAPWYAERGPLGRRTLRFLGSGEVCTDYLTIMALPGRETEVIESVADFLLPDRLPTGAARWHTLDFDGIDAADATMTHFVHALEARGGITFERPGLQTWRIALPATIADFANSFSKTRRKHIRKWLADIDSGAISLSVARNAAEFEHGWATLVDLHQRRRQSLGQPGCFASEQFSAFQAEVARALLDSGRLQLTWIELNGQPAAAEYMLVGGGVTYCYQSGIEPLLAERQPGHIAVLATIDRAIACGCTHYDFMRGDEPYKARWHAEPQASKLLRAWPGRGADRARREAAVRYQSLRAWAKRRRERDATPSPVEPHRESAAPQVPQLQEA